MPSVPGNGLPPGGQPPAPVGLDETARDLLLAWIEEAAEARAGTRPPAGDGGAHGPSIDVEAQTEAAHIRREAGREAARMLVAAAEAAAAHLEEADGRAAAVMDRALQAQAQARAATPAPALPSEAPLESARLPRPHPSPPAPLLGSRGRHLSSTGELGGMATGQPAPSLPTPAAPPDPALAAPPAEEGRRRLSSRRARRRRR